MAIWHGDEHIWEATKKKLTMHKQILNQTLQTVCWLDNKIVDWNRAGISYSLTGEFTQLNKYHFGYNFDKAISSPGGEYVFICQRLGTKGLLVKNGEILREINRSYYQADVYEYPAEFLFVNDKMFLIHCPISYCQIDFEDVETGEIVTNIKGRKPSDFFHSRLEVSPNNKYLVSKGWFWHPLDLIFLFDIEECLKNPLLLDNSHMDPQASVEISTASFIDDFHLLIGSHRDAELFDDTLSANLKPGQIAIWNLQNDRLSESINVESEFGNLMAINDKLAWDTYKFPKIINLETGKILDKDESIYSGEQKSSILFDIEKQPQIAFSKDRNHLAIRATNEIIIVSRQQNGS